MAAQQALVLIVGYVGDSVNLQDKQSQRKQHYYKMNDNRELSKIGQKFDIDIDMTDHNSRESIGNRTIETTFAHCNHYISSK